MSPHPSHERSWPLEPTPELDVERHAAHRALRAHELEPISPADPLILTLLQAPPHHTQGKVISYQETRAARPSYVWSVHLLYCPSVEHLAGWLTFLEGERECVLIRGCPLRGEHRVHESLDSLREALAERRARWWLAQPVLSEVKVLKASLRHTLANVKSSERGEEVARLNALIDERFEALEAHGWYTRRKSTFREVARRWVWLDLDQGLTLPHEVNLNESVEHHAALRWVAREGLPSAFHGVSFVGQWSSSAFLKGRRVKAHLAFLFDQPLDGLALKAWAQTWPLTWDPATLRTVQPHFTAAPVFKGSDDPLPQRTFFVQGRRGSVRLGWLESLKLEATINASPQALSERAKRAAQAKELAAQLSNAPRALHLLETSSSPAQGQAQGATLPQLVSPPPAYTSPAEPLIGAEVEATAEGLRALHTQTQRLAGAFCGERNRTLYLAACTLGRYEGGAQLGYEQLKTGLLEAAQRCGLLDEVGPTECARQIDNGVRWGRSRPISAQSAPPTISLHDERYSLNLGRELNSALFQAQRNPHKVIVLALTCGGGKTTALCAQVARDAAQGKTRVVLCRNHLMAEAFAEEVERYAQARGLRLKGRVRLLAGLQRHCAVLAEASAQERPALERALSFGRKALCGQGASRCERAASCEGAKRPEVLARGLTIATHAMGSQLTLPEGAVVMIDELPTPVTAHKITLRDLAPLTQQSAQGALPILGSLSAWLEARPALRRAAEQLIACLKRFARAGREERASGEDGEGRGERYGSALSGAQALELLTPHKAIITALLTEDLSTLPSPSARAARQGHVAQLPAPKTLNALKRIAEGLQEGRWPQEVSVYFQGGRAWLEVRELYSLPNAPLVALDGTAQRTARLWSQLAAASERSAEVKVIAAVGQSPLFARWVETKQLRTSQLIHRSEGGQVMWRSRAVGALKRAIYSMLEAARDAQLAPDRAMGVLAAKHVADALRLALSQGCEPAFDPQEQVAAELIQTLREALVGRRVVIGHVGAHDIGSNLYHGVDVLVLLGSSKPDWGSTIADLRALGVPEEECSDVYAQIISARDVQALARARHLRREGVGLLYVGDMSPPTGHDLPDVQWTQVEAAHPRASQAQLELERAVGELLFKRGYVCPPELSARFQLTRDKAKALCERLKRHYELVTWEMRPPSGRGRNTTAYGLQSAAPSAFTEPLC